MEFSMNVDEKDIDLCKLIANEYVEDKNKVFLSSVGVCAFRNYLADCNIELGNTASLFRVKKIYETTDIADVNYKSITIDVRTYTNSDALYIPKKHANFNIPNFYYVLALFNEENNEVIFKGFIKAEEINKNISNDEFYIVYSDKLSPMEDLINDLYSVETSDMYDDYDLSETYVALLDSELTFEDEIKIISALYKSAKSRKEFLNYSQFEFIANKFSQYNDLFEQNNENEEDNSFVTEIEEHVESLEDVENIKNLEVTDNFADSVVEAVVGAGVDLLENDPELLERGLELISDGADMISDAIDTFDELTSNVEDDDLDILETFENEAEELLIDDSNVLNEELPEDIQEEFDKELVENILETDDLLIEEIDNSILDESDDLLLTETFDETELETENLVDDIVDVSSEDELFLDLDANDDILELDTEELNNSEEVEISDNELGVLSDLEIVDNSEEFENIYKDNETQLFGEENVQEDNLIWEETEGYPVDEDASKEYEEFFNNLEKEDDVEEQKVEIAEENTQSEQIEENIVEESDKLEQAEEDIVDEQSLEEFITEISNDAQEIISDLSDDLDEVIFSDEETENNEYDYSQTNDLLEELNFVDDNKMQDEMNVEENNIEKFSNENIQEVPENIDIQTLFEEKSSDLKEDNKLTEEEFNKYIEEPVKSNNSKIFVPLLSLVVFSSVLGAGVYYKSSHKNVAQNDNTALEQQVRELDEFDDETFLAKEENQLVTDEMISDETITDGEELIPNPDGNMANDINQSISNIFDETIYPVMISKIAWEIPENYTTSKYFKKYLQVSGVQLQRQLQQDLANVTEVSVSGKIKLSFDLHSDNEIKNLKVVESSGSKEIDTIAQKTLKETLMYIKVPVIPSSENFVNLTIVINF